YGPCQRECAYPPAGGKLPDTDCKFVVCCGNAPPCYATEQCCCRADCRCAQTTSKGIVATSEVPRPIGLEIAIVPPCASTRSISPVCADPLAASAPPSPSSRMRRRSVAPSVSTHTSILDARACLAALVSPSATT